MGSLRRDGYRPLLNNIACQVLLRYEDEGAATGEVQPDRVGALLPRCSLRYKARLIARAQAIVAAEGFLVRIENDYMVGRPFGADTIVLKRFVCVEVEDEDSGALLIHNQFVFLVTQGQELLITSENSKKSLPFVHRFVELEELTEA